MKTIEHAANTNCFTNNITHVFNGRRLQDVNLSDDNNIFRGIHYNDRTVYYPKIHNYAIFIQNILSFNLGVAFLKSVSIYKNHF